VPARRFFVPGVHDTGAAVEVAGSDAHKILNVLRLRDGDRIEIVDSAGVLFAAAVRADSGTLTAVLQQAIARAPQSPLRVDVAQALPKGRKMDLVVEKATELGAAAIVAFSCERSIGEAGEAKLERWRRLAAAAAQQCGRLDIPPVSALASFGSLLETFGRYDAVAFAWELTQPQPLRKRLDELLRGVARLLIVVGPEGGFSHGEADAAVAAGAVPLWLGPRILRTETAALALLAIVGALGPEPAVTAS
jgi:16S rRNA (uracil1498-N3)-methyltransferase